jgi:hypothetical protein
MHRRPPLALACASALVAACSAPPDSIAEEMPDAAVDVDAHVDAGAAEAAPPDARSDAAQAPADAGSHAHPSHDASASDAAQAPLPPDCDEDNTIGNEALGVDKLLPAPIVQYQRQHDWGCMHREWHEVRQWDLISLPGSSNAARYAYVVKKGWTRAAVQEGAPGNGLEFLAMHRVMLASLRAAFPQQASLFAGWTTPPLTATAADPLPPASATTAFNAQMQQAVQRLSSQIGSFTTDDALGLYVQSSIRWTSTNPVARSSDLTTGIHTYFHNRYDDPRSAIRMQRFNRNPENQVFWRLHGWLDGLWTKNRKARGLTDAADQAYMAAMNHACLHMGMPKWNAAQSVCAP